MPQQLAQACRPHPWLTADMLHSTPPTAHSPTLQASRLSWRARPVPRRWRPASWRRWAATSACSRSSAQSSPRRAASPRPTCSAACRSCLCCAPRWAGGLAPPPSVMCSVRRRGQRRPSLALAAACCTAPAVQRRLGLAKVAAPLHSWPPFPTQHSAHAASSSCCHPTVVQCRVELAKIDVLLVPTAAYAYTVQEIQVGGWRTLVGACGCQAWSCTQLRAACVGRQWAERCSV